MYIMLSKYINIPVFLVSLVIGFLGVYLLSSESRNILVYPTPENIDILQFKDKTNGCYSYEQTEIQCPTDKSEINQIPPQY